MFGPQDFLLGGIVPMLVAAAAFALVWRCARHESAAWSAGIVVGYAAGFVALVAHESGVAAAGARLIKPTDAAAWIPLIALVGASPTLLAAASGWRRWSAAGVLTLFAALAPLRLLWGGKYLPTAAVRASGFGTNAWSGSFAALILGAIATATLAMWLSWRHSSGDAPRSRGLLLVGAVTAAALTAALTGSFTFAQYIGVLAASIGGCVVAAWALKVAAGPEAAAGSILLVFASLLVLAVCNSEMKLCQASLLAVSAVLAAGRLPQRLGVAARTTLAVIAVAIPVGVAIADFAATQSEEKTMEDYYGANSPIHSIHPPPRTRSPA